jgi:hypothetical protein
MGSVEWYSRRLVRVVGESSLGKPYAQLLSKVFGVLSAVA